MTEEQKLLALCASIIYSGGKLGGGDPVALHKQAVQEAKKLISLAAKESPVSKD